MAVKPFKPELSARDFSRPKRLKEGEGVVYIDNFMPIDISTLELRTQNVFTDAESARIKLTQNPGRNLGAELTGQDSKKMMNALNTTSTDTHDTNTLKIIVANRDGRDELEFLRIRAVDNDSPRTVFNYRELLIYFTNGNPSFRIKHTIPQADHQFIFENGVGWYIGWSPMAVIQFRKQIDQHFDLFDLALKTINPPEMDRRQADLRRLASMDAGHKPNRKQKYN